MSVEIFEEHRRVLAGVAYRILGSVADAEDVVQEAWLRWSRVDAAGVADPRAFLVRVTGRLAIDRLRAVKARREAYVGPWLPEPVSTEADLSEHVELADSVDLALLVVLETLSPLERAVFVLREAFGMPFAEIGEVIGRAEPATRQLARRAREHVRERRPRFDVGRAERREVTERFIQACSEGDLDGLLRLLADDVKLVGDGGGKVRAPLRVLRGAAGVARFLVTIASERGARRFLASAGLPESAGYTVEIADVNGGPAVVLTAEGRAIAMISLVVADGVVRTVYLLANPEKMSHLGGPGTSESA
ncbi:RNA polymerase sigma factor SigJ [Sphaerisporangium sp. TRM90804]|uniref:RNA polymerase sigma factor SigJ n=1 Tax=Sphaerisporangium sp. TRM90804 TaxID=3031113 RepID=UPI00244A9FE2|nr:RNA polymerase sigma factor SigJ [Sphaerisporangium sp. TRM90804]MDH2428175.1 RNA polymerase sigma factor SigJ [Sphaerisporangium sp. TRM90804]